MHKRVALSYFVLMFVFGVLILNLFFINLDIKITETAQSINKRSIELADSRGMIYDCNMEKIVNSNVYNITVSLPFMDNLNKLSPYITNDEKDELYNKFREGKVGIIETSKRFNDNEIKTISLTERYSDTQPLCHIIGHLDSDGNGAMGLEKAYNDYLAQQSGKIYAEWSVNALGHILHGETLTFKNSNYLSPAGIQLTIDLRLQNIAESSLKSNDISKGAVVIMNSDTGELLAIASTPVFNPNRLENALENIDQPFINRAINAYSVGSIFKPIVAVCAIENNIDLEYNCVGSIKVNGTNFKCNNGNAHGKLNMKNAMEKSCNCYFIALGQKIGGEKILTLCKNSGLGKSFELADNFTVSSGILPNENELEFPSTLANFSFGQGNFLATPIQMASAYSVFANGGYFREPTLMKAIIDDNENPIQKVKLPEKELILGENTILKIDNILESVVSNGNGNKAYSSYVVSHGKTATAQSGWFEKDREINHTWFCGYFTYSDITYTVVIFKEDGISGAVDCAPVFREIAEKIIETK